MAGSATFESASASSSELVFSGTYLNGQRGPSLDRSGSYREGSEGRMLVSGFAVPHGGSSSVVASDEIHTLSQSISLEPIVIRHQIAWYDELRRVLGISTGSIAEENSFRAASTYVKPLPSIADLKDLKRFRLSVEDTCVKARVRANKMDERLCKLDKYYEDLTSKKQKRNELTSIDRSGALNLKMGTQNYSINQRVEDQPKNILLNKRVRTSVAESRAKDGNLLENNVGESDLFEKIRRLAAGGEGWDKKGKRKRSIGTVSTRPVDNVGVSKRAVQNKVVVENGAQPRDAHIYRLNNRDDSLSNRKRPMPVGSSSPPMAAQWVGQRPPKMVRARRPFLVALVPNQDEKQLSFESCSPPDVGARLTSKGTNDSPISKVATNGPKKLMVKLDNVQTSPRLAESHESVGGQSRFIDNEMEKGEMNAIDNKNKFLTNSAPPKPFQNRKTGCKNGRLKKLSDRKGFLHHSPLQNVSSPDCPGASDDDREELFAAANHARTATYLACSSPFWKKMEPVFASVSSEDKSFLSQQVDFISDQLHSENGSFSGTRDVDKTSKESIPLYQRVLSALIIEDDIDIPEEGDARNMQFMNSFRVSTYDTHNLNGSSYENTSLVDKLLLELKSIGLCPDMMVGSMFPVLVDEENETIQDEIDKLNTRLHQQEVKKKVYLEKISNNIDANSRVRDLETLAMDRLVEQAYRKLLVPKQAALAFGNRTLVRCHKFESSGISCFNEPPFHDILSAAVTSMKLSSDETFPINGPLSNRGRKKEVLLDDISSGSKIRKTKPRQKTDQIPTPRNKHTGTTHPTGPSWLSTSNKLVNDLEPLDEMGVGTDLGVPHDLTSFLNFDEQDPEVDFTAGLDIPMDDLTELF
ncbi:hypothetical protein L1987_10656 [Smallanthus sonchifolius]|uniref:Uncharacterized protein n=1 Tax=Smallanthus sonchifolius TaxID=185202 RepID=A0ACB9J9P9_9ASTR|nr:hypothetical protein L1987_10656 [Smallanthus sonchifolius]